MATDQEIRDAGFKYVPKQKYLQDSFKLSTPPPDTTPDGGITNTNAFNNSGNEFSVYNPDPNTISNRNYRPNYDYRQFSEYGSDPSTADIKQMDMNQNYYNKPPPSKMGGLLGMFPGVGIAKFLTNQIGPYIPPNRRAIMENELGGQGVMVNDIGQIVQGQGSYDDISGRNVMAGYNPYKMTKKTFDDRIAEATLKMDDDGPYKQKRLDALEAAKANFLKTQNKSDKIVDFEEEEKKKLREKTILGKFMTKRKQKQADKIAQDAQDAKDATAANALRFKQEQDRLAGLVGTRVTDRNTGTSSIVQTESGGNDRGTSRPSDHSQSVGLGSNAGNVRSANRAGTGSAQSYNQNLADGGRAGYFFGGRVNYKAGGRTGYFLGGNIEGGYSESRKDSGGKQTTTSYSGGDNDNDGGNNPPPTFYDNGVQVITDQSKFGFNYPTGLTKNLGVGQLTAILDAKKSLEEEEPEGMIQYDSSVGPINTKMSYDSTTGPEFNANYIGDNLDANYNTKTGLGVNYSKDMGPGTFTAGGTYKPDGTYSAEGKYVISYANGGLAGLL